ncbi:SpoIIIAH-like family protein [Haloimpatiens sp. FM7315]|uniref:SpoIIIAH-like family protein n=1 Tax=Haloimpatiens sp. FM7315 TaxID=3298609 RepID=UPI0035A324F3
MNKKQAVIIVTLLVLIVCVGMIGLKVNGPLISKNGGGSKDKSAISTNSNESSEANANYFTEAKMVKQEETVKVLQQLKEVINNENIDKDQKAKVIDEFNTISVNSDKENKVELALKGKGYEDVVCTIENSNKVRVVIKSSEKPTEKQIKEIHDVVMSITQLSDVEIENRE